MGGPLFAPRAKGGAGGTAFELWVALDENEGAVKAHFSPAVFFRVASAAYTYDANGLRVQKAVTSGTTTVYIFSGSKVIAEYDNGAAVGSPSREYIYSGGTLLAKIENSATVYYHQDGLSARVMTDSSGNKLTSQGDQGHYPFGELWYPASALTKWLFTTYERDAESGGSDGNDYAMARFYRDALGRFNSPDPLSGSTADPQSLDRYSYAENDPTDLADPSGSCPSMGAFIVAGKVVCVAADESEGGQQLGNTSAPWWGIGFWDLVDSGLYTVDFSSALPLSPRYNGYESFSLPVDAVFDARVSENSAAEAERMGVTDDSLDETGYLDMIGGGGDPGGGGGPCSTGTPVIQSACNQARLELSNPDCAAFLKSVQANLGLYQDLDSFLANFDALSIVPSPKGEKQAYGGSVAHIDDNNTSTVFVDFPNATNLVPTLLHEVFHSRNYLFDDVHSRSAAAGFTPGPMSTQKQYNQQESAASRAASRAFEKHCSP